MGGAPVPEAVRLARYALESFVRTRRLPPAPEWLAPALRGRRAGAFVCLKREGSLRGCIGTIEPVCASLAEEIMENAVSAGLRDPRFPPVSAEELPLLSYSVDVLEPPEPVGSPEELDPRRYGVVVRSGPRKGLLLPDLEGVDSVEEQLDIARGKAGILPGEEYSIERFRVVRYGEEAGP